MTLQVTLTVPNRVAESAQRVARQTRQPLENVLTEWLNRAAEALPIEDLSDAEILALCDYQMQDAEQDELGSLLAGNREGLLTPDEHSRLDDLMARYDERLLRKAQALRESVRRGLREPLSA